MTPLYITLGTVDGDVMVEVEYENTQFVKIWHIENIDGIKEKKWVNAHGWDKYADIKRRIDNIIEEM